MFDQDPSALKHDSSKLEQGKGIYAVRRAIPSDPILFIDLEPDEEELEEVVVDPGLAWSRAKYQATK